MLHRSARCSRESRRQTSLPFVPRPWTAKARDPRQSRSCRELSGVQRGVLAKDREHANPLTAQNNTKLAAFNPCSNLQ